MNELYDKRKIENYDIITESYVGYCKSDHIPKMTNEELEKELKKVNKDIDTVKSEIDDEEYPSFVLKERIENGEYYKSLIEKELLSRKKEDKEDKKFKDKLSDYKK